MSKRILVMGRGGREHALAWRLVRSARVGKVYVAPGNGGTREIAENVAIDEHDIESLARFAEQAAIDLTIVGPDKPLALGVADVFGAHGLPIFGPTCAAAEIEWSKAFAKQLMQDADIPTASFGIFREYDKALAYIRQKGAPIVVKASGLALGKGVYPCKTFAEAKYALSQVMLMRAHTEAGDEVIVEEFLDGQEISLHALCDGTTSVLFPPAQDHKQIYEGDEGKNTGGMGVIFPVPGVTAEALGDMSNEMVQPALAALTAQGRKFVGCLYPGIKMTPQGPKVLEYNARFGDPEAQVYMRLIKTDLFDVLEACAQSTLSKVAVEWWPNLFAVCVVIASGGYPGTYRKGLRIRGIREAERVPGVVVFHAGTKFTDRSSVVKVSTDKFYTAGGRVLGVSAVGHTLREALDCAYEAVGRIRFEGMYYRRDIGAKALAEGR